MFNKLGRNVAGGLAVGLWLVGCQPEAALSPASPTTVQTIHHALGTSEVPVSPQRVVVLDTAPLDAALALGIQPIGTVVYGQPPEYLKEQIQDIEIVGEGNQPNLETILRLKPDLILGSKVGLEDRYEQLTQIAPTVLTEGSGRASDWQENLQLYAQALGKSAQAERLLQAYQQSVLELQEKIGQPQSIEVSVLIAYTERLSAYTTGSFSGSVLQDVGVSRNPAQDDSEGYALRLSPEALDELDGDYIFLIYSTSRQGGFQKEDFVTAPIWSQLQAVQKDRVCQVNVQVWIAGRSILAANQILRDIEACLIE
ncbi:MAG: iron-siderophore ABC transporter substrate-binding protein [Cyanobacteria bacterium J06649_4]